MTTTLAKSPFTTTTLHCETTAPTGWNSYLTRWGYDGFHLRAEWASVFQKALRHRPYFLWVEQNRHIVGVLPLMHISGPIFGSFLVSQPYLNTGGVLADTPAVASQLIDCAVALADSLNVKHLELRHERRTDHGRFNSVNTEKVHMRLELPTTTDELWTGLKSKLRSQVRKPLNWHCLKRSVERGQKAFDFGRCSHDSGTFKFKQQWGAEEYPAVWQYCLRKGDVSDVRPNSGKFDKVIAVWQKLPVWLTQLIGPEIVRGIP